MTIQNPCAKRSRPWVMICVIASSPLLRSMVIGDASANAQPKKGIESNSFLATKASGGEKKMRGSGSQVEECLDMTIFGALARGVFLAPDNPLRITQIPRGARRIL